MRSPVAHTDTASELSLLCHNGGSFNSVPGDYDKYSERVPDWRLVETIQPRFRTSVIKVSECRTWYWNCQEGIHQSLHCHPLFTNTVHMGQMLKSWKSLLLGCWCRGNLPLNWTRTLLGRSVLQNGITAAVFYCFGSSELVLKHRCWQKVRTVRLPVAASSNFN